MTRNKLVLWWWKFFWCCRFFNNAYYAKVGGISTSEMNKLEMKLLFSVDFRLQINVETFRKYCLLLEKESKGCQIDRPIKTCWVKGSWSRNDECATKTPVARWRLDHSNYILWKLRCRSRCNHVIVYSQSSSTSNRLSNIWNVCRWACRFYLIVITLNEFVCFSPPFRLLFSCWDVFPM